MKQMGIYTIKCLSNGKVYVGSAVDLISRKSQHFYRLRKNKHGNSHLQNAYNKYGEQNFIFEIVEIVEKVEDLILIEQKSIDDFSNENELFNIRKIAKNNLGLKHTKESIVKMTKSGKENGMYGKTHSQEARQKMSESRKNKPLTEEWKKNMSLARIGKKRNPLTDETKQKLHDANKGENCIKAKLNWQIVRQIREEYSSGLFTYKQLGDKYGVYKTAIEKIVKNQRWVE